MSLSDWTNLSQLEDIVEPARAGIYALSRDGLRVHHLGRSAGRLRNRIRSASSADRGYKYFRFAVASSLRDAFRLHCEAFHRVMPLESPAHPLAPPGSGWLCPVRPCNWGETEIGILDEPVPKSAPTTAPIEYRWSMVPEDLRKEPGFKGIRLVEFEGAMRPRLGQIVLLARIGGGGMGTVYFGVHRRLENEVAVKVLTLDARRRRPSLGQRFIREAKYAAQLRSPHIVQALDVDEDEGSGCQYIVLEYVAGVTARDWVNSFLLRSDTLPSEQQVLEVAIASTRGLATAHMEGIVHRDIKPGNILIPCDPDGQALLEDAKLADLGIARADVSGMSITRTQMGLGTPGYTSPEQAQDAKSARKPSDVFGMGATIYALLCGHSPFASSNIATTILKIAMGRPDPIEEERSDINPVLQKIISKCLEPERKDRFQDASALLRALEFARETLKAPIATTEIDEQVSELVRRDEQGKPVQDDAPPTP